MFSVETGAWSRSARLRVALTMIGLFVAPSIVRAAPITFDFEDQPLGAETPLVITEAGLTASFAGPSAVDPGAFQISYNSSSGPFSAPYRTLDDAFLTVGPAFGAPGSALTITFDKAVTGIVLDFALDDYSTQTPIDLAADNGGAATAYGTITSPYLYPEGTLSFTGPAFSQIVLSSPALDFQIDNIAVTAVPEPPALALLLGLPAIGLAWRRPRQ